MLARHVAETDGKGSYGECDQAYLCDEGQRARLMAEIMRLIREPSMPQATRLAGLTFIGWLARRKPDEMPHAVGIEEARESERRIKASRTKTR
ncbi:MAG: hypothetical protein ACREJ3_00665 [Polyangiaceae bacterium]